MLSEAIFLLNETSCLLVEDYSESFLQGRLVFNVYQSICALFVVGEAHFLLFFAQNLEIIKTHSNKFGDWTFFFRLG